MQKIFLVFLSIKIFMATTMMHSAEDVAQVFAEGMAAFKVDELDKAITAFKSIIKIEPNFVDAHYHLGLSYYRKAEFDQAITSLKRVLELLPRDLDVWVKLGMAYYKKGDFDQAAEAYQEVIKIEPKNIEVLNNLGMAYDELSCFDEAILVYQSALKIHPDHPQILSNLSVAQDLKFGKYSLKAYRHYRRGQDYFNGNQFEKAITEWKLAISESSTYTHAYLSLAEAYFNSYQYQAAIGFYQVAQRLSPNDARIAYNLGNAHLKSRSFKESVCAYQQAIKIDHQMTHAYVNLGNALFELKLYGAAISAYQKALQLDPSLSVTRSYIKVSEEIDAKLYTFNAYLLWRSGSNFLNQGNVTEAIEEWETAVKDSPRYTQTYESLGWAYLNTENYSKAIESYRIALEIQPNLQVKRYFNFAHELKAEKYSFHSFRLWNMGRQLIVADKLDQAIMLLEQSIKESPNFSDAYNTLAWIYVDKLSSNLDEAERLVRKAIYIKPEAVFFDTLSWILYKQERYVEAVEIAERAIKLDPNQAEHFYHASLAYLKNGQKEEALENLKRAVILENKFSQIAQQEIAFASLNSTSDFQQILKIRK